MDLSGETIMSNPELAVVLDFLFAAKLEPVDAFAAAKSLLEAGIKTREDLASLTPARAKELTVPKIQRKVLAALRKMPTLDGSSALDEATSPKKRQAAALPPPSPSATSGVYSGRSPGLRVDQPMGRSGAITFPCMTHSGFFDCL